MPYSTVGVSLQREWLQHQEDLQGTGHAVLHRTRLAGPDEQARVEGSVQQETHGGTERRRTRRAGLLMSQRSRLNCVTGYRLGKLHIDGRHLTCNEL